MNMQTFDRLADGLDPLETSSDRDRLAIEKLAAEAMGLDLEFRHLTSTALAHAEGLSRGYGGAAASQEVVTLMMRASRAAMSSRRMKCRLVYDLLRLGYRPGAKVTCGNVVIRVEAPPSPCSIEGIVLMPDASPEPPESPFDPDLSDRAALAELTADHAAMVRPEFAHHG